MLICFGCNLWLFCGFVACLVFLLVDLTLVFFGCLRYLVVYFVLRLIVTRLEYD